MTGTNEYSQLSELRVYVLDILGEDTSGHGLDHVERVYRLARGFACEIEQDVPVDIDVLTLGTYLHDVDDYKLVGKAQAEKLTNAHRILAKLEVDENVQQAVLNLVSAIGYSKALRGKRPTTIEGQLISDADMNDAIGANGILRCFQYAISDKGSGAVFDPSVMPHANITAEEYNKHGSTHDGDSFVNHFFEKLLLLSDMMMTDPGRREAMKRQATMLRFLEAFFTENNAPEWNELLVNFLKQRT